MHGCLTRAPNDSGIEPDLFTAHFEEVKEKLEPLSYQAPPPPSSFTREYFKYYGLETEGAEHIFGTFCSSDKILAAHVFRPSETKGTVILLHGYCDHSGVWKHLIKAMVEHGYTVAAYDHPGHGLSWGDRASIDDFSEYAAVLEEFLRISRANLAGPFHLVAHSMGGAVAIDYILTGDQSGLNRVVLIAPLVHSAHWNLSKLGHALGKHFTDSLPRVFQETSSDEEFLTFTKTDPLQARRVPLRWFAALVKWNDRVEAYEPTCFPIKVIQGTGDVTVDWEYNIEFIQKKFVNADISIIENGGHHLLNESLPMRDEVISLIIDYLG